MHKKLLALIAVVMTLAMVLAACEPAAAPSPETIIETVVETVIETVEVEVPVEVEVMVEPEVEPIDRTGGWFDTVVVIEEPNDDAAVTRLEVGEIDAFVFQVANPEVVAKVEASANIDSYRSSGSYNELSFNPTGPVWDAETSVGPLNPFAVARIREAMNYLIDREFLVEEILGGLGTSRWTAFNSAATDSALFAAEIRAIELKYPYNPELAEEIISEEMAALGAVLQGGVWTYEGETVVISILIRIEDARLEIGDYVANQLEDIGFEVIRDYKSAADASPIWLRGDPNTGEFHIYTGGWITTNIPRDLGGNFAFFYTDTGLPFPMWQNYVNDPEFYEIAQRLDRSDYSTLEERGELVARALELSMQDGYRLFLHDRNTITPKLTDISVAADLYGGISGAWLWALTIQRQGELGGSLTLAMPSILTEPWNPIAGSNWIYDMMLIRGTSEMATYPDPFTGLALPNRITSADVVIEEGLPVFKTLDWVNLSFEPEIVVPEDAWADWDAETQQFITVGQKIGLPAMDEDPGSIVDIAVADGRFTTLVAALTAADLAGTLAGEGPFTVFAPTDDAFAALPEGTVEALLEDIPALTDILLYHVVSGYAPAEKVVALNAVTTLLGKNVEIRVDDDGVFINDSQVVITDIMANNGVIHVIDAVLLPPEGDAVGPEIRVDTVTALRKSTVYYQEDLFDVVFWHDGSPISMGDFVMFMIMVFDRAKEDSAIYDDAAAPAFASFMQAFKGVRVTSVDPLIIETYSDVYLQDAEQSVTTWWPFYDQGTGAWHNMYLGILAEAAGDATFGPGKADVLGVDRISYIAGPTLEILKNQLDLWTEEGGLPYEPTFSQFVAEDEVALRIENLTEWHRRFGHFWVGTGPYYLQRAFPVEGTVILVNNPLFPDQVTRWARFAEAAIPVVEVDGATRVTVGDEEVYEVMVTFQGQPYPLADITNVSFLVVDATNQIAYVGEAVGVADGLFEIVLTAEITSALATGSNTLEVVVVSNLVAVPVADGLTFVTVE